jgi:hypothetical protein
MQPIRTLMIEVEFNAARQDEPGERIRVFERNLSPQSRFLSTFNTKTLMI